MCSLLGVLVMFEAEIEGGAVPDTAFASQRPAVTVDDPRGGSLARRRFPELVVAMNAAERLEQLVGEGHVEANAVVADHEQARAGASAGEFHAFSSRLRTRTATGRRSRSASSLSSITKSTSRRSLPAAKVIGDFASDCAEVAIRDLESS